ncbi:MAG TPA: hypothetical protein VFM02_00635 [Candidatus Paceibacterota bacterium]|nr:hypothetical protein [Candidatus Paceibacterota bacterium]
MDSLREKKEALKTPRTTQTIRMVRKDSLPKTSHIADQANARPKRRRRRSPLFRLILLILILLALLGLSAYVLAQHFHSPVQTAIATPSSDQNIENLIQKGESPFTLLPGFTLKVFAEVPGAYDLVPGPHQGEVLVSSPSSGQVVLLSDRDGDGVSDEEQLVAEHLDQPEGLEFHCGANGSSCKLTIAEAGEVSSYDFNQETNEAINPRKLFDLSGGTGLSLCDKNSASSSDADQVVYVKTFCRNTFPSSVNFPAHSDPLGFDFFPETNGEATTTQDSASSSVPALVQGFPRADQGSLLVALHGSWNDGIPVGYKVVQYFFDKDGKVTSQNDFLTGWIRNNISLGRPADILMEPGVIYISDDKAGLVYSLMYQ